MYTLYGNSQSTTLARVIFCFLELGLKHGKDFAIKPVAWSDVFTADFATHQPFKQLPYMVMDETGMELYESRSIIKCEPIILVFEDSVLTTDVAAKVGSDLHVTSDLDSVAKYETACSIELANFTPFVEGLMWELILKPAYGAGAPSEEVVKHMSWMLSSRLEGYERLLSTQPFLAGERLTLADLFHVPHGVKVLQVKQAQALVDADGKSPNLAKWWKAISERSTWVQAENIMAELAGVE